MGCSVVNKDSTVISLSDWITKVKFKKTNCKQQKRRNLLVQAVLSNALSKAEHELRMKQQERRLKWELIKNRIVETEKDVPWDDAVCHEINTDIDHFMNQMKFVQCSQA